MDFSNIIICTIRLCCNSPSRVEQRYYSAVYLLYDIYTCCLMLRQNCVCFVVGRTCHDTANTNTPITDSTEKTIQINAA